MKSFRFKFTVLIWTLLAIVLALGLGGLAYNIYSLIALNALATEKIVTTAIILVINLVIVIFALSIMIFSKYVVKNGCVYSYFGFIRSKSKASEIVQFTHFKKSDKLVAYFTDQKYSVIVIAPENYEKFIATVREINPKIYFSLEIDGQQ